MTIFPGCIKLSSSDTGKCRKRTTGKVCVAIPGQFEVCFNVLKHLGRSPAARIEGVQCCGDGVCTWSRERQRGSVELMWLGKWNAVLVEAPCPRPAFTSFLFLLQLCPLLCHTTETCVHQCLPPVRVPYCFNLAAEGECRCLGEERSPQAWRKRGGMPCCPRASPPAAEGRGSARRCQCHQSAPSYCSRADPGNCRLWSLLKMLID